jgi:uncharacterized protein
MSERSATAEGTRALADRHAAAVPHGYVSLGSTGLSSSRIGFGCYRVEDASPAHREALEAALAAGCNLIDTSTNYTDGASESLVGQVLQDLERGGRARREELIVVSKIGYVQGRNLEVAGERERQGRPFPEMVKYTEDCWHCIHPEFLQDQLARSRERLQIETLDVCLLHNPEYFLSDAMKHRAKDLEAARAEFYRRVREAFAFLEGAVARGEVRWYGVSSNTLVSPPEEPEATSAGRFLAAAEEAAGPGHHFRVLQMPLNLFESGGVLVRNTGPKNRQTPLEAASASGLGVLINRPLNAFADNRLIRLAGESIGAEGPPIPALLSMLKDLRQEFAARVAPPDRAAGGVSGEDLFQLVDQIGALSDQLQDTSQWLQIEQQYVIPRINHVVRALAHGLGPDKAKPWQVWWDRYHPALQGLLRGIGRRAAMKGAEQSRTITEAIDPGLPPERRGETLSRKALWTLASTPGVSCVLVGMRRPAYVQDAMGILAWPPLADPLSIYPRVRA